MISPCIFANGSANPIVEAFWNAAFQLIMLAIVGFVANIIFRRLRDRSEARQELLKDIDDFGVQLYKPRKMYQVMVERPDELMAPIGTKEEREARRLQTIHETLKELVEATGRFRTLQVALISLYGFNLDLLGRYLAIWYYLKELRRRMEKCTSLLNNDEKPGDSDDFYRLFDTFRYRVSIARYEPPAAVVQPPPDVLDKMHRYGRKIHEEFFGKPVAARPNEVEPSD